MNGSSGSKLDREEFEGTLERIVFYNPENGYTVCRFASEGAGEATVVGSFPPLSPGETLKLRGRWEANPRFGRQFRVESFVMTLPASAKGIEKFLASGMVKGIGPVLAKRIVGHFGPRTLDILSSSPESLREVAGVGAVKLAEIRRSWAEHRDIRDLVIFLQAHDVSTNLATKIHRQYGERAFQVLKTNPYQLSQDIWGVGFKTADRLALRLGLDPDSPERVKAFILHLAEKDNEQGHVFSLEAAVRDACGEELGAGEDRVASALDDLLADRRLLREETPAGPALYRPALHQAEVEVAEALRRLADFPCRPPEFDLDRAVGDAERGLGLTLSPRQREAVRAAFERKLLVITGGPGTGKTTIIRAIVDVFEKWGREVILAAPTGRAAKRLGEATRRDARTIHRVLEYTPRLNAFKRDEHRPLRGDALIVDEVSMVDLSLMHRLLRAVPARMRLVLVGDKDQLPPVGPGSVLHDIIASGSVAVVRLDEIFRQEKESLIVANAHRVNQGQGLVYPPRDDRESDFYFLRQEDERKTFETVVELCRKSVPRRLGLSPLSTEIQVISPMYKGLAGVDNLNAELQRILNPGRDGLRAGSREFRPRDKIMQVRNDYEREVFNGDVGTVLHVDPAKFRLYADFYGRTVAYEKEDLNDVTLAYAVSVHKAQGSEYQAVILPLLTQHFIMLQRNLFYTALTRARKLSVIVGSVKALHIAIKNDRPVKRNGLLRERLERLAGRAAADGELGR